MKQQAARRSTAIKVVSSIVIGMTIGFFIGGILYDPGLLIAGFLLIITMILCYLWSPKEYEIENKTLKVIYHWGGKEFPMVKSCSPVTESTLIGIRIFGNGGVFACTGLYWNKIFGTFRAYTTSARLADLVLIETEFHKIVISPENREDFIAQCKSEIA